MDASEREKERLRKLAELYERTDLDDEQYRHEYEKIASEYQEDNSQTGTMPVVDSLDSTIAESKEESPYEKATQHIISDSTINSAKSEFSGFSKEPGHNKETMPSGEYQKATGSVEAPSIMDRAETDRRRDTFSSSQLQCVQPTITMKRVRARANQFIFVPLVFALGIGLALAIGMVKSSKVENHKVPTATAGAAVTVATPKPRVMSFILPRFGPDAVASCKSRCSRWGGQENRVCNNGCQRRSLEMYGRRITLEELNPRAEADEIVQECLAKNETLPRAENEQVWRAGLKPFVMGIKDVGDAKGAHYSRELYQELLEAQAKAVLPPEELLEEDELTQDVLGVACLIAQDALALWAFETVERQDDEFSAAFYAQLREELTTPKFTRIEALKDKIANLWGEFSP